MPTVPYNPVPDVAPSKQAIGPITPAVPAGAFGAAAAAGQQRLGGAAEHVGDEIFTRALALQHDANVTEADAANNKFMIESGKLRAQFLSTPGLDAARGLDGQAKALQKLRDDIGKGVSNDAARRMYDSGSRATMVHAITSAAEHAGSEQRKYAVGTAQAQLDLISNAAGERPMNQTEFDSNLEQTVQQSRRLAATLGLEGPQEEKLVRDNGSKFILRYLSGYAREKPYEAGAVYDKVRGMMTEDDRLRADGLIKSQSRTVGAINIANEVFDGGRETEVKVGKVLEQMEDEVRNKAKELDPKDPLLEQHAVSALQGRWNQAKRAQAVEQHSNQQIVGEAILRGVKNEQELRADPKVNAAIEALPEKDRLALPGQINRYNDARDRRANEVNFLRLRGLAQSDTEAFLRLDLSKEQLGFGQLNDLLKLRSKIIQQPLNDPRVGRAIMQIRDSHGAELQALGIYRRDPNNPADYDQYVGALQQAVDVWQEVNKRPPSYKDVTEVIGPDVIRSVKGQHSWAYRQLFGDEQPRFKIPIPDEWREGVTAEIKAAGGKEPSEELLRRAYTREVFKNLYGARKTEQPTATPPLRR